MPTYVADWLSDGLVSGMRADEEGTYWRLLCISWREHGLGPDLEEIREMTKIEEENWARVWKKVGRKLRDDVPCGCLDDPCPHGDGRFRDKRQESERRALLEFREQQRISGRVGAERRWHGDPMGSPPKPNGTPMAKHGSASASASASAGGGGAGSENGRDSEITPPIRRRRRRAEVYAESSAPEGFVEFIEAYPRQKEIPEALKAWRKVNPEGLLDEAIQAALDDVIRLEWRFRPLDKIPYPASWLNAGGHLDRIEDHDQGQPYDRWWVLAERARLERRGKALPHLAEKVPIWIERLIHDQDTRIKKTQRTDRFARKEGR